jgi:alpha-amylase/alpha-mannosidase (GH57 family)
MSRYICIHGHFYQPPRENPWLEEIELQDSSHPYHDWNERITAECYAPNAAARILDHNRTIREITCNYTRISFDFGPTLLTWLERRVPEVYASIIEADRESRKRFSGHGSALAQVYNHLIMPLANKRDKQTQVIWGIADFEHRFGRLPEGMWLPETAVDLETLEILAQQGIRFTILAPRQARRVRPLGEKHWHDVDNSQIDPKRAYLCRLRSGRSINMFFYDGPISQDIAFGGSLNNGEALAQRWLSGFTEDRRESQLVHFATDGETYGHHHRHGEMALAFALHYLEQRRLARLTVYGEFLEKHPPQYEVEIIEDSSWSCVHGIQRWCAHCGCNSGRGDWTQHWRAPLRKALDWLRDELAEVYQSEIMRYLRDPWAARDDYICVILDRSEASVESFLSRHALRELQRDEKVSVLRLLEMQRQAMLMFTSCGWFFDEISGLETTQVMQYAARSIQLAARSSGVDLESGFLDILRGAGSNLPEHQDGAEVYLKLVKPSKVDLLRVGAHYAVSSLFEDYPETSVIYSYTAQRLVFDRREAGRHRLAVGKATLRSNITWAERTISFAVLHLGDHSLVGGAREFMGETTFAAMYQKITEAFSRSDVPEVIRLIDRNFEDHNYSLWYLFRDEQRKIFTRILDATLQDIEASFHQIYEQNYPIVQAMRDLNIPLPKALAVPMEYTLKAKLRVMLQAEIPDLVRLKSLMDEINGLEFETEKSSLGYIANRRIETLMERFSADPRDLQLLQIIEGMMRILRAPSIELDLMKAQNLHFHIARTLYHSIAVKATKGDESAQQWIYLFDSLGDYLQIWSARAISK